MSFNIGSMLSGLGGMFGGTSGLGGMASGLGNMLQTYAEPSESDPMRMMSDIGQAYKQSRELQGTVAGGEGSPPIQGQGRGLAGVPGFRGNNYGMMGDDNLPSQELFSILSGMMQGSPQAGESAAGNSGPMGVDIGTAAGKYLRGKLGGLFGGSGSPVEALQGEGGYQVPETFRTDPRTLEMAPTAYPMNGSQSGQNFDAQRQTNLNAIRDQENAYRRPSMASTYQPISNYDPMRPESPSYDKVFGQYDRAMQEEKKFRGY